MDLRSFYEIYLSMMRRFNSTPKPFSMMEFLLKTPIARLTVAEHSNSIIAGVLHFFFNHTVTLWCGASSPDFYKFCPNNAILHHIINWACQEGYNWIDFGASPPERTGLVSFKEQWGAKKYNFSIYAKVYLPLKRKIWITSEPSLRGIYSMGQHLKSRI